MVGKLPTICLSVFDHFSELALKGLYYKLKQNDISSNARRVVLNGAYSPWLKQSFQKIYTSTFILSDLYEWLIKLSVESCLQMTPLYYPFPMMYIQRQTIWMIESRQANRLCNRKWVVTLICLNKVIKLLLVEEFNKLTILHIFQSWFS